MTQQPDYLRYLESAKQAELASQLREEGFTVELNKKVDNLSFDLVAKQGERAIAYEFRSVGGRRIDKAVQRSLQELAKRTGMEFRVVIVNPPPRVKVEIDSLQRELLSYALDNHIDKLDTLSTHTSIERIDDLEISEVRVSEAGTKVKGTGTVSVTLQYGSGSDDGPRMTDAYPLFFEAMLGPDQKLALVSRFEVDASSFTE